MDQNQLTNHSYRVNSYSSTIITCNKNFNKPYYDLMKNSLEGYGRI